MPPHFPIDRALRYPRCGAPRDYPLELTSVTSACTRMPSALRSRLVPVFIAAGLALLGLVPQAHAQLRSSTFVSGLSQPVAFVQDPADDTVQFVVQQGGRIRVVQNGVVQPTDFLNLTGQIGTGGERGLLGLAFAPNAAGYSTFFVNFTNTSGHTVVARYTRSANPLVADAASRFDLRFGGASAPAYIAQPYSNHNGGDLAFGSDGYLFIGMGDGGSSNDPEHRAQNPAELLGKMLRIDIDVSPSDPIGYRIPGTNPFIGGVPAGVRPEIWSFGHRNPWRFSFDDPAHGGTGALIMGDVGQNAWEEVNYEPPLRGGRNYGWRNREGAHSHITSLPAAASPLTDPIFEYDHSVGSSISGGFVYRGTALGSTYRGRYFFADFVAGRVWSVALTLDGAGEATASGLIEHTSELGGSLGNLSAFGVDADGELYIVSYSSGRVLAVAPGVPTVTALSPSRTFPVVAGTSVTWTATATGGLAPLTYRFLVFDGTSWTVGRDWSSSNTWVWTPLRSGTHSVQVWVRNAGSVALYDAWLGATATISAPPVLTLTGVTPSIASAAAGTPVTWSAFAAGGTGPYTYKFWMWDGSAWTTTQDWSPMSTWTWTPVAAGSYQFQVWVRNAGSAAPYDAWRTFGPFTATRPASLTVTALTADSASPQPAGTPVTWSASAAGGTGPYTYQFWVFNGASWSIGQAYSTASSWTWVPPSPGTYSVQVWVRNAGSGAAWDAWRSGTFTAAATAPLTVTSLGADRSFPVPAGTPVQWRARAAGGSGPYTYKFYVFNGTSWTLGRDWNSASTWTWVPPATGTYTVQAWVRNAGSGATYDAWRANDLPITVGGSTLLTVSSLTLWPGAPLVVGGPTTMTARASGGTGPYTYQFWVFNGSSWSIGQAWSGANTFEWTPPAAGTYAVQVWVRNTGSVSAQDAWAGLSGLSVVP